MCNLSISQFYTVEYFFFFLLHVIIIFAEIGIHDQGAVVFLSLMAFVINDSITGVHNWCPLMASINGLNQWCPLHNDNIYVNINGIINDNIYGCEN